MMDDIDEGARTGVWVALGVVAFLLFGLLGSLMIRQINIGKAAAVAAAAPAPAAVAAPMPQAAAPMPQVDEMKDVALTGVVAGTLFFATGSAALPADAGVVLAAVRDIAAAQPGRNLLISGFHDATGDPVKNAELAKERAKAVREALVSAGVDRARLVMRKPESTTGEGDNPQARRVEVRAVE
jgi:outer membrane protein OmpA-like peptidoglycan-associated protein